MTDSISLTYDYLCPFARNANEMVVEALAEGTDLDVLFVPFSLKEAHADADDVAQWELPLDAVGTGVLALLWSIAIRDNHPDLFLDFHVSLFNARHDDGSDINNESVIEDVCETVGLDPIRIRECVATGVPAKTLATEHSRVVEDYGVFGVPTFIQGDEAVFVRFMDRHEMQDLERVLEMLKWTNLNEFKRTRIDR
ncbi:MAG: DsbA family protein [Actinomycetia bacterium]|nr:DsbA family protein [Actinomycetes bacterium]